MDNTTTRGSYQRRNTYKRRKKKSSESNSRIAVIIFKQLIFSVLIFLLVSASMNFNSPATEFFTDKVGYVMEHNVEVSEIFGKIYAFTDVLKKRSFNKDVEDVDVNKNTEDGDEKSIDISDAEDSAVPASAQVYKYDEDFTKLDYGGIIEESDTEESEVNADEKSTGENISKSQPKTNESSTKDFQKSGTEDKANLKFILPVDAPLGSKFGDRIHPIKGSVEPHKGIDLKANYGVAIKAAMAGKVIEAGPCSTFGNLVKIDHQNGYITLYAHCSVVIAKVGNMVKQGDVIAKVGSTGSSTGPHLHFEIWKDNKPVDPLGYVKIG